MLSKSNHIGNKLLIFTLLFLSIKSCEIELKDVNTSSRPIKSFLGYIKSLDTEQITLVNGIRIQRIAKDRTKDEPCVQKRSRISVQEYVINNVDNYLNTHELVIENPVAPRLFFKCKYNILKLYVSSIMPKYCLNCDFWPL